MSERVQDPTDVWGKATALQLLKYIKLLGVEHHVIAKQLGVSHTAISLWYMGRRPIPAKYRPGLLEWAGVAWQHALERNHKEVQTLPTDELKRAAVEAFHAPLHRWYLEVLHETGLLEERLRHHLRDLRDIETHRPLTASDLRDIVTISSVVTNHAKVLLDMREPEDTSATQTQDGEP
jgi:hypothetical protein